MKQLTREQEIELMVGAPARMQASARKWLTDPQIRTLLRGPVPPEHGPEVESSVD